MGQTRKKWSSFKHGCRVEEEEEEEEEEETFDVK